MTLEELKRKHQEELSTLLREQSFCNHIWGETKYDPEIVNEPKYETKFQGSDCYPELVGYTMRKVDRWSKTCKKCGKVKYTKEQMPVKFEPKF